MRGSRLAVDGIAGSPVEMGVSLGMNIVGAIKTRRTEVMVSARIRCKGCMSVPDLSFSATQGLESRIRNETGCRSTVGVHAGFMRDGLKFGSFP